MRLQPLTLELGSAPNMRVKHGPVLLFIYMGYGPNICLGRHCLHIQPRKTRLRVSLIGLVAHDAPSHVGPTLKANGNMNKGDLCSAFCAHPNRSKIFCPIDVLNVNNHIRERIEDKKPRG